MHNVFIILLTVHFLVDYFLQNNEFINKKNELNFSVKDFYKHPFIIHIFLQVILPLTILFMYNPTNILFLVYLVLLLLLHGVIDLVKIYFRNRTVNEHRSSLYISDQILHIIILFAISYFVEKNFTQGVFYKEITDYIIIVKYILTIILITKVANVTFKEVFSKFSGDYSKFEVVKRKMNNTSSTRLKKISTSDIGNENAGAIIGSMERLLIFICLVTNNFGTIGFVLAAKSVARFKKLDQQKFGEYFIIGTLFSILYTISTFYLVFKVL